MAKSKSLAEKMNEAFYLAMDCCYATICPRGHYFDTREGIEVSDSAWGWADGLTQKYYHDKTTGRCSIKAMIEFDVSKFEENVDRDIAEFVAFLSVHGKPRRMTPEEMVKRGYEGYK